MTNTELILNMLAEASTKDISQATQPQTFSENKQVAQRGGSVARAARERLEAETGNKVVTSLNAKKALENSPNTKDGLYDAIQGVKNLQDGFIATNIRYWESKAERIISEKIDDSNLIEHFLDSMLDFLYDKSVLNIYRNVCIHFATFDSEGALCYEKYSDIKANESTIED